MKENAVYIKQIYENNFILLIALLLDFEDEKIKCEYYHMTFERERERERERAR